MNNEDLYWIGLSDEQEEGSFVWESGLQLSATIAAHWNPGMPDNHGGNEHCGVIYQKGLGDVSCSSNYPFVCQKERTESIETQIERPVVTATGGSGVLSSTGTVHLPNNRENLIHGIIGYYEIDRSICLKGKFNSDDWYFVKITWNAGSNTFTWQNKAGVSWTLTPMVGCGGWDKTKLAVGKDNPYWSDGYITAAIEWVRPEYIYRFGKTLTAWFCEKHEPQCCTLLQRRMHMQHFAPFTLTLRLGSQFCQTMYRVV